MRLLKRAFGGDDPLPLKERVVTIIWILIFLIAMAAGG
jgi:hypothetical protein